MAGGLSLHQQCCACVKLPVTAGSPLLKQLHLPMQVRRKRLPELLQARAWQAERLLKHAEGPVVLSSVVQVQPHLQKGGDAFGVGVQFSEIPA